jgi:hypothetical protein
MNFFSAEDDKKDDDKKDDGKKDDGKKDDKKDDGKKDDGKKDDGKKDDKKDDKKKDDPKPVKGYTELEAIKSSAMSLQATVSGSMEKIRTHYGDTYKFWPYAGTDLGDDEEKMKELNKYATKHAKLDTKGFNKATTDAKKARNTALTFVHKSEHLNALR